MRTKLALLLVMAMAAVVQAKPVMLLPLAERVKMSQLIVLGTVKKVETPAEKERPTVLTLTVGETLKGEAKDEITIELRGTKVDEGTTLIYFLKEKEKGLWTLISNYPSSVMGKNRVEEVKKAVAAETKQEGN